MNEIVIQRVNTARQRKQFLELPWTIYRGDPNWIPPLRMDQKENVGYIHNPFYDRNQIQTFLAYRGTEVVGRIGAVLNRGTSTATTTNAGSSASSSRSTIRRWPTGCWTPPATGLPTRGSSSCGGRRTPR